MAMEDVRAVRRLLRTAFSEILTLSDRLTAVEQRNSTATNTSARKKVDLSGLVDLTAGALSRYGRREEVPESSLVQNPLVQATLKFPLPFPHAHWETTFATSSRETRLQLKKVLFRGDWFENCLKFVCCPVGGSGPDIVPTLNPNAGEGLSRVITAGCPVHQECADAASIGGSVTKKGNMIATGLFHQNRTARSLTQDHLDDLQRISRSAFLQPMLFSDPFENLLAHALRIPNPRLSFGVFGPLMQHRTSDQSSPYDSRRSPWMTENVKFGSVGAWNVDDEYVLSGWWSVKNPKYRVRETTFDSCGVALSTFPYANTPTHKIGFQVSHTPEGNTYSIECSSKHATDQDLEVHPGLVVDFSSRGVSALLGIKTLLKF